MGFDDDRLMQSIKHNEKRVMEKLTTPVCPKCGKDGKRVDSSIVYGKSYGDIWHCDCEPDGVYVGINKRSGRPLGTMADKELREYRKQAHAAFDPLWKEHVMSRSKAYEWLSNAMNIESHFCHIGMFDVEQCKIVIELSKKKRNIRKIKRPKR